MNFDSALADSAVLTPRQRDCLVAIQQSVRDRGVAPTLRELAGVLDCRPNTVHQLLTCLEERGAICRAAGQARGITVVKPVDLRHLLPDVSPYLQRPVLSMAERMRAMMKAHKASNASKIRLLSDLLTEQRMAGAKSDVGS